MRKGEAEHACEGGLIKILFVFKIAEEGSRGRDPAHNEYNQ